MLRVRRRNEHGELVEVTRRGDAELMESPNASPAVALDQVKHILAWIPRFGRGYRQFYDGVGSTLEQLEEDYLDYGARGLANETRRLKEEVLAGLKGPGEIGSRLKKMTRELLAHKVALKKADAE